MQVIIMNTNYSPSGLCSEYSSRINHLEAPLFVFTINMSSSRLTIGRLRAIVFQPTFA